MASSSAAPGRAVAAYRFGPYEADLRNAELRKFGIRIRVERKPWTLLLALLDANGELVKRSELERRLWPEGLFVDFEHGLNVAVQKLRQALCDSADQPRYIETVAREGYRFIASVERVTAVAANGAIDNGVGGKAVSLEPAAVEDLTSHRNRWLLAAAVAVALLLLTAAAGLFGWRTAHSVHFAAQNWVLIADFDNRTGQPVLDGTLELALEREISNSQFVRVAPRERAQDSLRLMRKPLNSRVDRALGREICLRDGDIQALITGRVEKLGPAYILSAEIVNPGNGVAQSSFEEEVRSESELPSAVRRLSGRFRRALGENPELVQQSLEKLEKVTTPSLRALQLFSQADRLLRSGKEWPNKFAGAAAQLLEEALKEDPNFASAHLWLYYAYDNVRFSNDPGLFEKEKLHLQRAFELAGTVPERERLFIQASYYRFNERYADAVATFETLVRAYPDHLAGQQNLLQMYSFYRFGGFDKAEQSAVNLVELRPHDIQSAVRSADILTMYLWDDGGGSEDEVRHVREFNQKIATRIQSPAEDASLADKAGLSLVLAAQELRAGNVAKAKDAYDAAVRDHRTGDDLDTRLMVTAALLGKLHDAQRFADSMPPSVGNDLRRAYVAFLRGDSGDVRRLQEQIVRDPTYVNWDDAVALPIHLGMWQLAEQMHHQVTEFDKKDDLKGYLSGKSEARRQDGEFAFRRGELADAIAILERYDLEEKNNRYSVGSELASETLAKSYVRLHRFYDALRVLRQGANDWSRPIAAAAPYRLRLRFMLADVYRELGRISDAEKIEAQLRNQLTYADADNPMLISLQQRLAAPVLSAGRRR